MECPLELCDQKLRLKPASGIILQMFWNRGHLENLTGVRREGGDVKGMMDVEIVGLLARRWGRKIAGGGQERGDSAVLSTNRV